MIGARAMTEGIRTRQLPVNEAISLSEGVTFIPAGGVHMRFVSQPMGTQIGTWEIDQDGKIVYPNHWRVTES